MEIRLQTSGQIGEAGGQGIWKVGLVLQWKGKEGKVQAFSPGELQQNGTPNFFPSMHL